MDYLALRKNLGDSSLTTNIKDASSSRSSSRIVSTSYASAPDTSKNIDYPIKPLNKTYSSSSSSSSSSQDKKLNVLPPREPLSKTLDIDKPSFSSFDSYGAKPKNGFYDSAKSRDERDNDFGHLETFKTGPPTMPKPFPRWYINFNMQFIILLICTKKPTLPRTLP